MDSWIPVTAIGLRYLNVAYTDPGLLRETAVAAEEAGVESLWVSDHIVLPHAAPPTSRGRTDGVFLEPFVCLSFMAAVTKTVLLGTGVLQLPLRHPLAVAKSAVALDAVSGQRLLLGVGCGWLRQEFAALGIEFTARGRMTNEFILALRRAWASEESSFVGDFSAWTEMEVRPRPERRTIPIVIGGGSRAALRRALRHGDEFFPTGPQRFALIRDLRRSGSRMPVTLGISADDTEARRALYVADRVLLPVVAHDHRPATGSRELAVRRPDDVAAVMNHVLQIRSAGQGAPD